jgi:hypothetical protein
VSREMDVACDNLENAVRRLEPLDLARIEAEGEYRSADARAYRDAMGPVEDRKRAAWLDAYPLWKTWQKAESAIRLQNAYIRVLERRFDKARTEETTERTLAGSGRHP